jgi:hypothetical protein
MPGLIGAIAAMIASAVANNNLYGCRDPYPPEALMLQCVNYDESGPNITYFPDSGQLQDIFPGRNDRSASEQVQF